MKKYNLAEHRYYGLIYLIKCYTTGKVYVGQTTYVINGDKLRRVKSHFSSAVYGSNKSPKLYNAIRKYGRENFYFGVVDFCYSNQEDLDKMEMKYIFEFNSINEGFNIKDAGSHGHHNDETKKKISVILKGRKHTEKALKNITESNKKRRKDVDEKLVIETYLKIDSIKKTANMLNINVNTVYRVLKENNIKCKKKNIITEECRRRSAESRKRMKGTYHITNEHKEKIRKAFKLKGDRYNYKKIENIDELIKDYLDFTIPTEEIVKKYNTSMPTLRKRIKETKNGEQIIKENYWKRSKYFELKTKKDLKNGNKLE